MQLSFPKNTLKAVLFDMDGVLFDTMPYHARAWTQAMTEVGLPFNEYEAYLNEGRTGASTIDTEFVKFYGRPSSQAEQQRIYSRKSELFQQYPPAPVVPFALELAQKIKTQGLQTLVVTGSGETEMFLRVQQSFPGIFDREQMVTAYDVIRGKPHPEPYLKALEKAGVQSYEAVVIENAPLGVEAGVAAGIFTIAVNTGILRSEVLSEAGASLMFNSMKELYDAWDNLTH
ncbi:MAG: HAD-IA family hydrolase [Prevotellaceae bacterium]|nr:HAD-IA family hydrolase [Prevotellaceae bacterium]